MEDMRMKENYPENARKQSNKPEGYPLGPLIMWGLPCGHEWVPVMSDAVMVGWELAWHEEFMG